VNYLGLCALAVPNGFTASENLWLTRRYRALRKGRIYSEHREGITGPGDAFSLRTVE
jgi:hypothetical protein